MLIRLAEMYLIKAECQMELGQNGEALNTLNYLRAQRAISGKDNSISGTVTMETILDERCLEFLGEGDRWFDLKRTHTLIDRVKKYNNKLLPILKSIITFVPFLQYNCKLWIKCQLLLLLVQDFGKMKAIKLV